LGKAAVRAKVNAKDKSAASTIQATGAAAVPIEPTTP
jgi:hypothetical protein